MKIKFVADSSADLMEISGVDFSPVPLTISTDERDYVDDASLNVEEMADYMASYEGRSRTACPNIEAWLEAFGDADIVYVATITSNLSGTYNAAMVAKEMYLQSHPDAKVHVFDSLSTGPELRLLIEKVAELAAEGKDFDTVCAEAKQYLSRTRLFFSLESLHNLVQNGRVNKIVASVVGVLGIRLFGTASTVGTLEVVSKCRNEKRVIASLLENLEKCGYQGGKIYFGHVFNPNLAAAAEAAVKAKYPTAQTKIYPLRGLCTFYAERGGMLVGVEGTEFYH